MCEKISYRHMMKIIICWKVNFLFLSKIGILGQQCAVPREGNSREGTMTASLGSWEHRVSHIAKSENRERASWKNTNKCMFRNLM